MACRLLCPYGGRRKEGSRLGHAWGLNLEKEALSSEMGSQVLLPFMFRCLVLLAVSSLATFLSVCSPIYGPPALKDVIGRTAWLIDCGSVLRRSCSSLYFHARTQLFSFAFYVLVCHSHPSLLESGCFRDVFQHWLDVLQWRNMYSQSKAGIMPLLRRESYVQL